MLALLALELSLQDHLQLRRLLYVLRNQCFLLIILVLVIQANLDSTVAELFIHLPLVESLILALLLDFAAHGLFKSLLHLAVGGQRLHQLIAKKLLLEFVLLFHLLDIMFGLFLCSLCDLVF